MPHPTQRLWSPLLLAVSLLTAWTPAQAQPREDAPLLDDDTPMTLDPDQPDPGDGDEEKEGEPSGSGGILVAEFGLEERNVVLSAAKNRTTLQEAPAIVTVITANEIRTRGYRTLNDVLQTLPGFEGDRWDGNGWTEESFARGQPRGLLVLLNGVNIVDPIRNTLSLDRKIPMEAIERVEVVSGPGGVLWGSNALLGIVNVITKGADDLDGRFEVIGGGGSGPGELGAGKAALSYGDTFFDKKLKIYSHLSFFTTRSAELEVDHQKVVGVLPPPSPDGTSLFLPGSVVTEPSREYFVNWIGRASLFGLTLEWMVPWEQDGRQLATGGSVLTTDYRTDRSGFAFDVESQSRDSVTMVALGYQDRFASDSFGLSAKAFLVHWKLEEEPFGAFAPSSISPQTSLGVFTRLRSEETRRVGLNLDMDLDLPADNRLTFGGEAFQDHTGGVQSTSPIDEAGLQGLTPAQLANVSYEGPDGAQVALYQEPIVLPKTRNIAALYLRDEFKANAQLALSAGARLQVSDAYDPATLLSAALVWNMVADTFLKLNYAEGFRPPNFQATDGNNDSASDIRFEANPDLNVERSRAVEAEVNTVLFKGGLWINRLYIRVDYGVSLLDDVIVLEQGRFTNSGRRLIHSTEALGRLELRGGHEIWAAHSFVDVEDSELGTIRNIANHTVNVGGRAMLLADRWELSSLLTWIGPREDRNRAVDPTRDSFASPFVPVTPTDVVIERLEPVWLLRVGTRVLDIYDTVTLGVFGYNVLNQQWSDPDLFFDDRIMTRPFPKPRWSVFGQAEARF